MRPLHLFWHGPYLAFNPGKSGPNLSAHRAVALAFHGLPTEGQRLCRHRDGNPSNNTPENLAWGTHKENSDDMSEHGTRTRGESHPSTYLTEARVLEIYALRGTLMSQRAAARESGIPRRTLLNIWQGNTWGWLTGA